MDDTKKMFRAIINGQSAMKSDLLGEIKKVDQRIENLEKKVDLGFRDVKTDFKNLTKRVDKLGLQLAKLEDDAPTIEEFDKLEKRVASVEQKVVAI